MSETSLPTYRLDGNVAVITMDDGKANVFSNASLEVLEGLLDQVAADEARALVLVGRPGKFSAGFDLAEMTSSVEGMRALVVRGCRWWMRLYGLGIPTVAACTGHALAGGALTLLSCDVRVGADVQSKIGLNEVAIGMTLPIFAVELARDRLAPAHLLKAVTGQVYDPNGACEVGFLDRVVPEDALLDEALAEARALAERNTTAYGGTKKNLRGEMIERCLAGVEADMAGMAGPKV
ncbi:MAG: crotonase/enoyl-CoA hydratase family protein [Acidimicrobiales bacterium]|nr:crotonase/enoyl-CoA hydratase family protein [Acidimicrobiales bacterium]